MHKLNQILFNFCFSFTYQLEEAILNGAHPISVEQAVELAGLQCQAEMGNMVAEKIKSTSIEWVVGCVCLIKFR